MFVWALILASYWGRMCGLVMIAGRARGEDHCSERCEVGWLLMQCVGYLAFSKPDNEDLYQAKLDEARDLLRDALARVSTDVNPTGEGVPDATVRLLLDHVKFCGIKEGNWMCKPPRVTEEPAFALLDLSYREEAHPTPLSVTDRIKKACLSSLWAHRKHATEGEQYPEPLCFHPRTFLFDVPPHSWPSATSTTGNTCHAGSTREGMCQ
eukprot:jgi/Mesvir1/20344/Mv25866-RA.1